MSASILIVEDDPDLLETLAEALTDTGYTVTAVPSSQAALDWAAAGHPFDLVLTDVRMAGVDGIQALAQLREHRAHVRGIIMTGYASPDAPQRAISAGAWDYLFKPFSEEQLLTAVDRVLRAEQKSEELRDQLGPALLEHARAWLQHVLEQSVERLRQRTWWAYYVGIRSKLLQLGAAQAVYHDLERLERARLTDAQLEVEYKRIIAELEGGYKSEGQLVGSETPAADFARLYGNVASGKLAGHLLPLAPATREHPDSELHDIIWR